MGGCGGLVILDESRDSRTEAERLLEEALLRYPVRISPRELGRLAAFRGSDDPARIAELLAGFRHSVTKDAGGLVATLTSPPFEWIRSWYDENPSWPRRVAEIEGLPAIVVLPDGMLYDLCLMPDSDDMRFLLSLRATYAECWCRGVSLRV